MRSGDVEAPAAGRPLDVYFPGSLSAGRYQLVVREGKDEKKEIRAVDLVAVAEGRKRSDDPELELEPGDLIATGTPAGTAPMKDGDQVEVEIPGVGVLTNPVKGDHR